MSYITAEFAKTFAESVFEKYRIIQDHINYYNLYAPTSIIIPTYTFHYIRNKTTSTMYLRAKRQILDSYMQTQKFMLTLQCRNKQPEL